MDDAEIYNRWCAWAEAATDAGSVNQVRSCSLLTPPHWRARLGHSQGLRRLGLALWKERGTCVNTENRSRPLLAAFILIGGLACTDEEGKIRRPKGPTTGPLLPCFGLPFEEVMKNIELYEGSYKKEAQSYPDAGCEAHRELSELLTLGGSIEAVRLVEDKIRRMDEIHDHFLALRRELQRIVEAWRLRA